MRDRKNCFLDNAVWHDKLQLNGWVSGSAGSYEVIEKATQKSLGTVASATRTDVEYASKVSRDAQHKWFATHFEERSAIFRRAANLIESDQDGLAEWIMRETGAIRAKAVLELRTACAVLNESAGMLTDPQGLLLPSDPGRISMARRLPRGVVGVISPFNFPLILSIRSVSPALATGNGVILKPDPQTVISGGFLIARALEEAGLPLGLLHVLPGGGDVGEALCTDPNIAMVCFTGSTDAGRRVGEVAGRHLKKVSLELGGKNSLIILEDADLELAASNAAFGSWMHQGQICMTSGRILVHEKVATDIVDRLVEKANRLPVGDPMAEPVALGPMINARQVERLHNIVCDSVSAGARLRAGGCYEGLFYRPTVLDSVTPAMRSYDEEMFGPVASVTTFSDEDEAVALANDTEYGLAAAVISKDPNHALSLGNRLNTGLLHINDQTVTSEPYIPFGGQGHSGNGSRVGGPANWEEFTQWQWVTIKDAPKKYPF